MVEDIDNDDTLFGYVEDEILENEVIFDLSKNNGPQNFVIEVVAIEYDRPIDIQILNDNGSTVVKELHNIMGQKTIVVKNQDGLNISLKAYMPKTKFALQLTGMSVSNNSEKQQNDLYRIEKDKDSAIQNLGAALLFLVIGSCLNLSNTFLIR